jgi:peptidyl-prolyl cis-trans isomerase SurA
VVERVVAVVGEQAILLSDLRHRARPVLMQIYERVPPGAQRSAVEDEMYKELLQQMIDERLVQAAAERIPVRISSDQVDKGLRNLAASQNITVDELLAAAVQGGLSIQELREQVQRQLLEDNMLRLRVVPRVRISSEDVRLGYQRLQREERKRLTYRPQWIVLLVPQGAPPEVRAERRKLAEQIVAAARHGASFADLVNRYSDDKPSKASGGDIGVIKPGGQPLAPPLEDAALGLDVGEISAPVSYGSNYVILRIAERDPSSLPPLEKAQERVASEVFAERLQKARRQWLDELKRSIYVDVRRLKVAGAVWRRTAARPGRGRLPRVTASRSGRRHEHDLRQARRPADPRPQRPAPQQGRVGRVLRLRRGSRPEDLGRRSLPGSGAHLHRRRRP